MKLEKPRDITLPTGTLSVALAPDGSRLFAGCMDGQVFDIEVHSGVTEAFADKHTSYASGCVVLPDGRTLISAGYDGWLMWHDLETKRSYRRVKAHEFWSWQLALSGD